MKIPVDQCIHLTVNIVREIHDEAVALYGGSDGIRDSGLLESAVAAPQATLGGKPPYSDLTEIAGAYLFYLCRNHPFVDGNKRTALGACIVFLKLNGLKPLSDRLEWENLVLSVAASAIGRDEMTIRLRALVQTDESPL